MQENPFYNTFNQFIVLGCLALGILVIVIGIVSSRPTEITLGLLFILMSVFWVASLVMRYRKGRR